MISLSIVALLALSLGVAIIMARRLSDAAVYQGAALAATTNYMEQLLTMNYSTLQAAADSVSPYTLPTQSSAGVADSLITTQNNSKTINIGLNSAGAAQKTFQLNITPTLTDLSTDANAGNVSAIEILMTYSWLGPDSHVPHQRALRVVRSSVPTYY
jgi:hypothetical protein